MKIDSVVVLCWAGDFRLARICLSSVRYFYPEIPLYLMKDVTRGDFDTSEVEKALEVQTTGLTGCWGPGMGKLELLFRPALGRFLFIDADEIMIGPVLDSLAESEADFVVTPDGVGAGSADIDRLYYDRAQLQDLDASYRLPRFHFNSGQFVAVAGKVSRHDFRDLVQWDRPIAVRRRGLFKLHEQGLLNYVLTKMAAAGRITLDYREFMQLARTEYFWNVSLENIKAGHARPLLFHWAGTTRSLLSRMQRSDLLDFFERYYYAQVPYGRILRLGRSVGNAPANIWRHLYHVGGRCKRFVLTSRRRSRTALSPS